MKKFPWESGARSYSRSVPQVFEKANGFYLYDRDGRAYLDFLCGAGTLLLGHNHPAIVEAITGIQDPFMNHLDLRTNAEEEFANTLLPVLPFKKKDDIRLHFCGPTGGDAVEAALKLAAIKTGRYGIFAFHGAYHGMSQGSLSVTSNNYMREAGLASHRDVTFMPYPYPYRFPEGFCKEESATDFCLAQIRLALEDDHSGTGRPGAMLVEPIQGEGGTIIAPRRFIQELRKICDEYDIVLIFDEIQAGLGRCGHWFCAENNNVEPDIITISKGIGGGFPMALIAFKQEMNCWKPGDHIGTFRGQQYAMTAGRALLETIRDENLVDNAKTQGDYMLRRLNQIKDQYPDIVGEVRGKGLYIGVEMNKNLPDPGNLCLNIKHSMLNKNIVMERGGRQGAVLRVLAPLTINREICDMFLGALDKSLAELSLDQGMQKRVASRIIGRSIT